MQRVVRQRKRFFFCLAVLMGSLVLTACLVSGQTELRITCVEGGRLLLVLPLETDECFTLHYYHSVENTPIWEVHSVDNKGRIYIEEERYLRFGAGMGRMQGVGNLVRRGPHDVIENMHLPTGDFILRVGSPGVDHTIFWRDTKCNLSLIVPHKAVKFTANPQNFAYKLWRSVFPHALTPAPGAGNV